MMGANNQKVLEKKLTTENGVQVLNVKGQYEIGAITYFLNEKYYIVPQKVLLTSLRFTNKEAKEKYLEGAIKDYENIKIKAK